MFFASEQLETSSLSPGGRGRDDRGARDGRGHGGPGGNGCGENFRGARFARHRARDFNCCRWCHCGAFSGSEGACAVRCDGSSGSACHTHFACGHGQSGGHHGSDASGRGRHGCHGVGDGRRGRAGDGGGDGRRGRCSDGGLWSGQSRQNGGTCGQSGRFLGIFCSFELSQRKDEMLKVCKKSEPYTPSPHQLDIKQASDSNHAWLILIVSFFEIHWQQFQVKSPGTCCWLSRWAT